MQLLFIMSLSLFSTVILREKSLISELQKERHCVSPRRPFGTLMGQFCVVQDLH